MPTRQTVLPAAATAAFFGLLLAGCAFDEPGPNPNVFGDSFNDNEYQRFGDALGPIAIDSVVKVEGFASLKITVPSDGCPGSDTSHYCYAGGTLVARTARDLSDYDALTFWAKASTPVRIAKLGFGNDNTGGSKYTVSASNFPLTTSWKKYAIPIPLPSKLTNERGLFYFAAGNQAGQGFDFWVDAVRFEKLGPTLLGAARPALPTVALNNQPGRQLAVQGATVTFAVGGQDLTLGLLPAWFTWHSSDEQVASVSSGGVVSTKAIGVATIQAFLGTIAASGEFKIVDPGTDANGKVTLPLPLQVFDDDFVNGAGFQAFDTALGTLALDTTEKHSGNASLRINIPSEGCPGSGPGRYCYAGGAVVVDAPQDLSFFNALTFWAKATNPAANFAVVGIGNDNTGTSKYTANLEKLQLSTQWVQYVVPLPLPEKLASERGLLWFAADKGPTNGASYDIYLDDVRFEQLLPGALGPPRVGIPTASVTKAIGDRFDAGPANLSFNINGTDQAVNISKAPGYLTWASSDTTVVKVAGDGMCLATGQGTSTITAKLGAVAAGGALSVTVR